MTEPQQTPTLSVNLAQAAYRDHWLHHYAIGDPSWDTFVREPGNPIYTGKPPYEWPVNGFLFRDPPTGRWYAYVGLYPRGYWPAGPCLVMRERPSGGWEEAGLAIQGDAGMFDGDGNQPGAMPDVSVVYADGRYHMVYDWANPSNARGGIAYAWAARPEGPFHRALSPIHEDTYQPPILGRYVRSYAATLIQRRNDWIILHCMSTPGNAGGTWAMACMTASTPEGPYSAPTLLLYPQSDHFLPPFMEYYPAFAHEGYIYAPATSVAANRNFQCVFRAPIEAAHQPEAWGLYQHGSVWHAESSPAEAQGIWGQTFSAQVAPDGWMRAYFTCKTHDDVGTVHIARRRWDKPYRDGFVLAGPNAHSLAILRQHYSTFSLTMQAQADGPWSLSWQCNAPLGPETPSWNQAAHPLLNTQHMQFRRNGDEWQLARLDDSGDVEQQNGVLRAPASGIEKVQVEQDEASVTITLNGQIVCMAAHAATPGRLHLAAEQGTVLRVQQFLLSGTPQHASEFWLSTEALAGAATGMDESIWQRVEAEQFRYGFGYVSAQPGARAKWNYEGAGFRLHAPRAPAYGSAEVIADGQRVAEVNLHAEEPQHSAVVFEHNLPAGFHAVALEAVEGVVPCDVLEVIPPQRTDE